MNFKTQSLYSRDFLVRNMRTEGRKLHDSKKSTFLCGPSSAVTDEGNYYYSTFQEPPPSELPALGDELSGRRRSHRHLQSPTQSQYGDLSDETDGEYEDDNEFKALVKRSLSR